MEYTCEFGDCEELATVHMGNSPVDRHYCDKHAESGLRKYLAAQQSFAPDAFWRCVKCKEYNPADKGFCGGCGETRRR